MVDNMKSIQKNTLSIGKWKNVGKKMYYKFFMTMVILVFMEFSNNLYFQIWYVIFLSIGLYSYFSEFCLVNWHKEEKYISPTSFAYNLENSGFKEYDEIKVYGDDSCYTKYFFI